MDTEGWPSQLQNATPVDANGASATSQVFQLPNNVVPVEASRTSQSQLPNVLPIEAVIASQSLPVEATRTSQSINVVPLEATRVSQSLNMVPVEASRASRSLPVEPSRASKSVNMMPVELARTSQLLLVPAEPGDDDVQTIKEVLSVHHVPVVASLHWEKLHIMLHTLCDRIAVQALRLEKAEEQGKTFLGFKEELEHLCRNCVKEMKEAKESEAEQQQKWSTMVEERLQTLQQGLSS